MVCIKEVCDVTGNLGKANSHFNPTQTGSGTTPPQSTHTINILSHSTVDGCYGNKTCRISIFIFEKHLFGCKLFFISIHVTIMFDCCCVEAMTPFFLEIGLEKKNKKKINHTAIILYCIVYIYPLTTTPSL